MANPLKEAQELWAEAVQLAKHVETLAKNQMQHGMDFQGFASAMGDRLAQAEAKLEAFAFDTQSKLDQYAKTMTVFVEMVESIKDTPFGAAMAAAVKATGAAVEEATGHIEAATQTVSDINATAPPAPAAATAGPVPQEAFPPYSPASYTVRADDPRPINGTATQIELAGAPTPVIVREP